METIGRRAAMIGKRSTASRLPKTDMWDNSAAHLQKIKRRKMKKNSTVKRFVKSDQMIIILTTVLVLMWAVTTGLKLWDYKVFKKQMDLQPLLPFLKDVIKLILIPSELLTSLLLVIDCTRRFGLKLSLALLITFSCYIIWLFITQPHLPCACGAPFKQLFWWQHLLFNCSFIGLNIWALILHRKRKEVRQEYE